MRSVQEMSTEELLRAIDYCVDTGTNLTSHGQADDYLTGSLQMANIYRQELKNREEKQKRRATLAREQKETEL